MTLPADPVWFITGCSTGFGRDLAQQVLDRGWRLVATARNADQVKDLVDQAGDRALALPLDVTKPDQIKAAVEQAKAKFGRIDVLVNNAGYGYMAAVEEGEDEHVRTMFETNFFGLIAVTKAVLPTLREQGSGFVINISSVAGLMAFPGSGYYAATKHGVEAISEALSLELKPLGPKVLLVEPGPFRTDFAGRSIRFTEHPLDAYKETAGKRREEMKGYSGTQAGDPVRAAKAIIEALGADKPPRRLVLGEMGYQATRKKWQDFLDETQAWEETSLGADFPKDEQEKAA
jgi:NAD(P)-dependent dehydrogenase (short-subunit alcohol dehydrogenase family)